MVEFVSWVGVAIIALFAVVGFTGVVVTSLISAFRALRHREASAEAAETPRYASAA